MHTAGPLRCVTTGRKYDKHLYERDGDHPSPARVLHCEPAYTFHWAKAVINNRSMYTDDLSWRTCVHLAVRLSRDSSIIYPPAANARETLGMSSSPWSASVHSKPYTVQPVHHETINNRSNTWSSCIWKLKRKALESYRWFILNMDALGPMSNHTPFALFEIHTDTHTHRTDKTHKT